MVVAAGAILGDTYLLIEPIGRGGAGVVWSAQHLRLPHRVAIKILHAPVALDDPAWARLRREAETTATIGHANIVAVHDVNIAADGTAYLVMEHLVGESLAQRLERGPLPLEAAQRVLSQLVSALRATHAAGIIHRDLKPSNIFLARGDRAKILDFGISKVLESTIGRTEPGQILGTPAFMAPEQISEGLGPTGPASDQYALGAVAYTMLTAKPPFDGASAAAVLYRALREPPPSLAERRRDLPATAAAAVQRAMARRPEDRYPTLGDFERAFRGDPVPSERDRRRLRWVIAGVAAATVLVGAMLAQRTDDVALSPPAPVRRANRAATEATPTRPDESWVGRRRAAPGTVPLRVADEATRRRRQAPATTRGRALPLRPRATELSAQARGLLSAGRGALTRRDFAAALQLAGRAARAGARSQGAALQAVAYCGARDRSRAMAKLGLVRGKLRSRVKSRCKALGMTL